MKAVIHTTKEYERWDRLAYKYYGNVYNIKPIIEANPNIAIDAFIPPDTNVVIPVLSEDISTNEELPPWKRAQ